VKQAAKQQRDFQATEESVSAELTIRRA